jgi:hypothetical protein
MFILGLILGVLTVVAVGVLALKYWEPTSRGQNYNAVATDQRVAYPWGSYRTQYSPTYVEQTLTVSETSPTGYTRSVSLTVKGSANASLGASQQFYAATSGSFLEPVFTRPLPSASRALPRAGRAATDSRTPAERRPYTAA